MELKSKELRRRFSAFFYRAAISWPYNWPQFVVDLRRDRRRNLKFAVKENRRARKPDGVDARLTQLVLADVVRLENAAPLFDDLSALFGKSHFDRFPMGGFDFREHFWSYAESIHSGGWLDVGALVRERPASKHTWLGVAPTALPSLPPEVQHVRVYLTKPLPSLLALVFDVELTEEATERFSAHMARTFVGEPEFRSFLFWKSAVSHSAPGIIRQREVLAWSTELTTRIEEALRARITAEFLSSNPKPHSTRLLPIECYELCGSAAADAFPSWVNDTHAWWKNLGWRFYWGAYHSKEFILDTQRRDSILGRSTPYRFFARWEEFEDGGYGSRHAAIRHHVSGLLRDAIDGMVLLEFISRLGSTLEEARSPRSPMGVDALSEKEMPLKTLAGLARKYTYIEHSLDSIASEFERCRDSLRTTLRGFEPLQELRLPIRNSEEGVSQEGPNLRDQMLNSIEHSLDSLTGHAGWLSRAAQGGLTLGNIVTTYRILRWSLRLTVVILGVSALTLALQPVVQAWLGWLASAVGSFVTSLVEFVQRSNGQ